ncbi:MAG: universal stress protein, partial [Acidobacteria bacterium]|nr:universal stress protein [Acidobacteriota bacterium]
MLMNHNGQIRTIWQQSLDECVHRFKAKGGGLLRDGPAAEAILSAAAELPAQLLVVGTQGRTGVSRIALGSVAETVVRAAPCSVLVVRLVSTKPTASGRATLEGSAVPANVDGKSAS